MTFFNPILLWGGLAAAGVAVPIIIHLLYRQHKRQTPWAAMDLLRRALVVRSGQVRLEDIIILALRCLALALAAFALVRPTFKGEGGRFIGAEQDVGAVVAVDASYSMRYGQYGGSRFDRAVARVGEIVATLKPGDDRITLVLMGANPRILLRSALLDTALVAKTLKEQAGAFPERLDLDRGLEELERLVAKSELKRSVRECYLVTDAQQGDWTSLSAASRGSIERIARSANIFFVPVESGGQDNLAVTDLRYVSGSLRRSEEARFEAVVRNQGPRARGGGVVSFRCEGDVFTQALGPLAPGQAEAVAFFPSFRRAGDIPMSVSLEDDKLLTDNTRHAVATVRSSIRVLCVNGEPSDIPDQSETHYLTRALRLMQPRSESVLQVIEAEPRDLAEEKLDDYEVVILANVGEVDGALARKLFAFVRRGGGLIVFAGKNVDGGDYNATLRDGDHLLLPGAIGAAVSSPPQARWTLARPVSKHPLAVVAALLSREDLDTTRVSRALDVRRAEGAATLLSLAGEREMPFLMERRLGAGAVLLFTTSADVEWSTFARRGLYAMLIQQSVTYLTSHPAEGRFVVGQPVQVAVAGKEAGQTVSVTDPARQRREVKMVAHEGRLPACVLDADQPGIYTVSGGDGQDVRAVAVNVDPAESDAKTMDAAALAAQMRGLEIALVGAGEDLAAAVKESRSGRAISLMLLVLAIVVLLVQSFLARYFTRRMGAGQTDVAAEVQRRDVAAARRA